MTQVQASGTANTGRLGPAGVAVTAAGLAVNALGYLAPLVGARQLSAADLGALATVLALLAVVTVPALGLQTALAVAWARDGRVSNAGLATAVTTAVAAGALAVATPLLSATLRVRPDQLLVLTIITAAVVLTSRWLGELQGCLRFGRLAIAMVLVAVARYGGVIAGLGLGAGVTGSLALGAVLACLTLPVLATLTHRTHPLGTIAPNVGQDAGARLHGRDVVAASVATFAMLAVSYADLILARNLLPPAESGSYAVGSVLTKGALWAPQVVTVLALPRLARGSRRTLLGALGVIAACGVVLVLAAGVGGGLAMRLAGGSAYVSLGRYAVGFAAVGALYSVVFVLVNAEIAARARWPAAPLWAAVIGLAVVTRLLDPPTLGAILMLSVVTATLTTVIMSVVVMRTRRTRG